MLPVPVENREMTTAEKMASSVVGVILARYVTPGLVALSLAAGTFIANGLFTRIDALAEAQVELMKELSGQSMRITALEVQRDLLAKMRDDDFKDLREALGGVINEVGSLRGRLESTNNQMASLAAKVDVLLSRLAAANIRPDTEIR